MGLGLGLGLGLPEKEEHLLSNSTGWKPSPCSTLEMRASIKYPPHASNSTCAFSRQSSSSLLPITHSSVAASNACLAAWYLTMRLTTSSRTLLSEPETAVCSSMPMRREDETCKRPSP